MASKGSKNNPSNKKESQKAVVVDSSKCEQCKDKCPKGEQYLEKIKKGGVFGSGVVCHLLKEGK